MWMSRGTNGVMRLRRQVALLFVAVLAMGACVRGFQVKKYPTNDGLFKASLAEYQNKKWDNAITGFEKLTLELSARDTLLPLAHWYLAWSHEHREEHILAATSFTRLAESFPDDSLADDALFQAGSSYLRLWKNPELDPQYGILSQSHLRTLLSVYPDSPLRKDAEAQLLKIDDMFAAKDYLIAVQYTRRGAFDSSIIYFKDVIKNYPNSEHARLALLRMVEVYRKPQMNYKEEAAETCTTLRTAYAGDKDVAKLCGLAAAVADSTAKPANTAKPVKPTVDAAVLARSPPR